MGLGCKRKIGESALGEGRKKEGVSGMVKDKRGN